MKRLIPILLLLVSGVVQAKEFFRADGYFTQTKTPETLVVDLQNFFQPDTWQSICVNSLLKIDVFSGSDVVASDKISSDVFCDDQFDPYPINPWQPPPKDELIELGDGRQGILLHLGWDGSVMGSRVGTQRYLYYDFELGTWLKANVLLNTAIVPFSPEYEFSTGIPADIENNIVKVFEKEYGARQDPTVGNCEGDVVFCYFVDNSETKKNRYISIRYWGLTSIGKSDDSGREMVVYAEGGGGGSNVEEISVGTGQVYITFKGPLVYIDENALDQSRTSFIIYHPTYRYDFLSNLVFDEEINVLFFEKGMPNGQIFAYSFSHSYLWEFEESTLVEDAYKTVVDELPTLTKSFHEHIVNPD